MIAESFERIHRANLVGMGVFPLTFQSGQTAASLGLDGTETYDFEGLTNGSREARGARPRAPSGKVTRFKAKVRVDTPKEWEYMENGGILHFVLRQLAA